MRRVLITGLLSSFALTAAAATSKPANDAPAPTQIRPVSTGVTNPQLVYSKPIEIPASEISDAYPNPARLVLKLSLDETGTPQNVQVVQPITRMWTRAWWRR
jgi:hypothetical protein